MNLDPISHFQKLTRLVTKAVVTNREGKIFPIAEGISQALEMILVKNRKIMIIGNGGSAAIASHFHNDLCYGVGIRATVFNDPSQLTALSNDYGYPSVFERPIHLWAKPGDLLIAISSSGKSENILRAVGAAQEHHCDVITFSGFRSENPLRSMGKINFYIDSQSYGEVEVSHFALTHYLTDCAMQRCRTPSLESSRKR